MRAKKGVSPYWVYCLAKDERFRSYAISSMVGSSGRQRVHSDYLKYYVIPEINFEKMQQFHKSVSPLFYIVQHRSKENALLGEFNDILLSKMTKMEAMA